MLRWHAKVICGVIMFVAMPICFLLPVKMVRVINRHGTRGQLCLDLLSCFAGGVFLSSYLVFMAPAVRVLIEENLMKPNNIVYPLPDMLVGIGFFVMLILDKIVNLVSATTARRQKEPPSPSMKTRSAGSTIESNGMVNGGLHVNHHHNHNHHHHHHHQSITSNHFPNSDSGSKLIKDQTILELDVIVDEPLPVLPTRDFDVTSELRLEETTEANGDINHVTLTRQQSIVNIAHTATPESLARSAIMMMALSIDSILEGMTIGLKQSIVEVWAIFIGIIVHESVIAFCLGLQLVRVNRRLYPIVLASVVYTLMNPIGVAIATAIFETMENDPGVEIANGVLQALTSGCFIYVIFYEILEGQITSNAPISKILAIFIGYAFLSSFAAIPGSSPYNFNCHETKNISDNVSITID